MLLFALIVVVSIYYIVAGIVWVIVMKQKGNNESRVTIAKGMILRGAAGIIAIILLNYLVIVIATLGEFERRGISKIR